MGDLGSQENFEEHNRRPAELLQLLPTDRIISETKQTQETDLKLSLGGIYRNSGNTLMRSSSVIGVENHMNIPERFLSLSKSLSLPADTKKNKGYLFGQSLLHNLNDQIHAKSEYSYRQFFSQDWQRSGLRNPNSVLQRNHPARDEGSANLNGHLKTVSPPGNPKPEQVSHSTESTTDTHLYSSNAKINGLPNGLNSFRKSPVSPAELKNNVNHKDGSNKKPRLIVPEDNNMELILSRMPSVTTIGDGPDGRKIEGFLYTYTRSQVSIVCVCHGMFLTPAEFVEHAGGKSVGDPMKRINVLRGSFHRVR